jgi:hypothetical protein
MKTRVVEAYSGFTPPGWVMAAVEEMVAFVPEEQLAGLDCIVLTSHGSLNRAHRRGKTWSRKRQIRLTDAAGTYHQKHGGQPAFVRIYVDSVLSSEAPSRVPFFRKFQSKFKLAEVLYHEIGHHIHKTTRPEFREREDVADDWSKKLYRRYFLKRHPFAARTIRAFRPVVWPLLKAYAKYRKWKLPSTD